VKEYLAQFHARFLHDMCAARIFPIYDRIWQAAALRHWTPSDLLHLVVQGKALEFLKRSKDGGAAVLGHPVMSHPASFREQLEIEHARLGIPLAPMSKQERDNIEEITLCDRLFCLSGLVRDSLIANGYSHDRIDVIPMHFAPSYCVPAQEPAPEIFRVLCVARISPIKGHVYLLEAWRKLALPNAELVLVGTMEWGMRSTLHRYDGLFNYRGSLHRASLAKAYQESSVAVLPSVQDGFGLVVSEALACGTPVIVTENVGARDIVEDGLNGLIVPPRDVDALADALQKLYASHELRRRLRVGALQAREKYPTVEGAATQLASLYLRLYDEGRSAC